MTRISIDTPCYFITSVTHDRLPIFRTDKLKQIVCNALDEARKSADLLYFGYAIMPDHFHIVTDGKRPPSDTVRFLNGITAKRVLDYLKENEFTSSLLKLRETVKERGYKHSVWEHHSDKFLLTSKDTFQQKIEYIHNNPIKDGLVERAEDYLYSSARIWNGEPLEDEPLAMNIDQLDWRPSLRRS